MTSSPSAACDRLPIVATASEPRFGHRSDPVIFGAFVLAALLTVGDRLLNDPDSQWHVRVGADTWRVRAVPWTDSYSHTFAGAPWIAKEWLSQLAFAGLHAVAGWSAVVAATAFALAALFGMIFDALRRRVRVTLALALVLLAMTLLAPHFLARPLVLGHLCLFAWTAGLVRAAETGRTPSPAVLLVLVVWANLHGSFTFAYPLAAAFGLEALLAAPAGARLGTAARWAGFGLASLAAGCATPYGIHAMGVTATIFGSGESLPFITEWQPVAPDLAGCAGLVSAAILGVGLAAGGSQNVVRLLILAGLVVMFARHSRFLDVYAVVAPMIAAGPLARRFSACRPEPTGPASDGRRLVTTRPVLLGGLALVCGILAFGSRPVLPRAMTPSAALAAARAAGATGPVYNAYDFGGFLMAEGVPTFIDGRTDQLFLGGFMPALYGAVSNETDGPFLALLDRHGVTWALVRPGSSEAQHLERAPNWRRLYADEDAAVYLRG